MRRHRAVYLLSAFLAFALAGLFSGLAWGRFAEFRLRSLLYRLNIEYNKNYNIVVAAIDEVSFEALKHEPGLRAYRNLCWPWPPSLHAAFIERLGECGAAKVGFDLLFSESFADFYLPQYATMASLLDARNRYDIPVVLGAKLEKGILTRPVDGLLEGGIPWGLANSPVNFANEAWQYDFIHVGHPSFALAVAEADGGRRDLELLGWTRETLGRRHWLTFRQTAERAFPIVSYSDVLLDRVPDGVRERWGVKSLAELVAGKTVLVGRTSLDAHDIQATPMGFMPGVVIHAHALQMLHRAADTVIREVGPGLSRAIIAGAILGSILITIYAGGLAWWLASALLGLAYLGTALYALSRHSLLLPLSGVFLGWLFQHVISTQGIARLDRDERMFIQGVFGKYVSTAVAEQLIADPGKVRLGGEEREITILFSDIANFTTISESLPPADLIQILNRFLGSISKEILIREGTLDKYIGDAIMAFWNAPLDLPNHAELACRAALAMQEKAAEFNASAVSGSVPSMRCRIGINTGRAIVGNAGSEERFSYTAIGDSVNTASRFEGLGKQYGVSIIIGEKTAAAVGDSFDLRLLDKVKVKGKTEPANIYHLAGIRGCAPGGFLDLHRKAMDAYFSKRIDEASALFRELADRFEDPPAKVFLKRLEEFRRHPGLLEAFDGVWTAHEK